MASDARDSSSEVALFRCPTCAATLEVVDAPSVKCKYCGNTVPVPAELRPHKPQVVIQQIDFSAPQYAEANRAGRSIGCAIAVIVLIISIGAVGVGLFASQSAMTSVQTVLQDVSSQMPDVPGVPPIKPTPGFATIVQEFGAKCSGPGQMDDARYVALDADGNIWTADYEDGRVQQFDPSGKFLQLIQVPADKNDNTLIEGLTADLKGNVYVARGGDILKYSSADGSLLKTFPGKFPDTRYQALAVDAQNNLYAIHSTASDNSVIKLNPDGKQLARWDDIVTKVNKKDAAMDLGITVDGVGNIYVASSFGNQVYIYDPKGQFIDRFGQEGSEPGQFSFPKDIAVDGQKHLYVHHSGGIDQFDTGGRFIGSLPIDYAKGSPRTVVVDREGQVYTVTSEGKVLKYQIKGE
ncbi:MAG TPA: SMP-30/gluconolactonase/LRE family protein [Anaerolineae bacterium]|nr:SMP-30/gluconolactonase/LRE family protein [Anaerolineae bacterium]